MARRVIGVQGMPLQTRGQPEVNIHVDDVVGDTAGDTPLNSTPAPHPHETPLQSLSPGKVQNLQRKVQPDRPQAVSSRSSANTTTTPASGATGKISSPSRESQPPLQASKRDHNSKSSSSDPSCTLETVPENIASAFTTCSSENTFPHNYLELSAEQFPEHPLLAAARQIPPAEVQREKHQNGDFEWVLVIKQPLPEAGDEQATDPAEAKQLYLGCNIYPSAEGLSSGITSGEEDSHRVLLLVTPLEGLDSAEPANLGSLQPSRIMAVPEKEDKSLDLSLNQQDHIHKPPRFVISISDSEENQDSVARIEDSFEALDRLEDQLEAFDEAAMFKRVTISEQPAVKIADPTSPSPRSSNAVKAGSASVRAKSASKTGQSALRKSLSLVFDSPKVKKEEKPLIQVASKVTATRPASQVLSKTTVKSSKPPTIPSFELPGEATARRLKEQREARVAAQMAEEESLKVTAQSASLRRSKSARLPTLPTFELPGEAISRRKREEKARQLKAQEEEERKRREFKARPIGVSKVSTVLPRETLASRARQQNRLSMHENEPGRPGMQNNSKRNSVGVYPPRRGPLESSGNQAAPRGRGLATDAHQSPRGLSHVSSTASTGQNSSISNEDLQQLRRRGEGVYRRDSLYAKGQEREKREREELARIARAEAAERSRQQSRDWAAKQARKRMTIGSVRDIAP